MTRERVLKLLRKQVEMAGGRVSFARLHNMHEETLGLVMRGKRAPGPAVLAALGLRRVEGYEVAK